MTIPNFNPCTNNVNQALCDLDLIPASQLAIESICSWRLRDATLEFKIFRDDESIRYSVYNHYSSAKRYWPNSVSSPTDFISVFAHCVWKGTKGAIQSRLFSDGHMAVLLSVNPRTKKIGVKEWAGDYLSDFLITRNPVISAIKDDASLDFQEEMREVPRTRFYDPEAEEGMIRYRRTPRGELVTLGGESVIEETAKVWPADRDVRLIRIAAGLREEIICRSFNWRNNQNPEVFCRLAPGSEIDFQSVDAIIQHMQTYTPQLENIKNKELITFYREHPLDCFMPDYDLFITPTSEVQRWAYNQFYRKEGENIKLFEYTNFVSSKKITFYFGKEKGQQAELMSPVGVDTWHIEMKRQAGWMLQLPIGICDFFSGMFVAGAQNPSGVDEEGMKRLIQGVPLPDEERNKIINDFALALGACSIINFYMACDRSKSQLEINGRVWVRSFGNAGRGIRSAIGNSAERLATFLGRMGIEDVNRGLENVARLGENANRAVRAWEAVRGIAPPQDNQAN